MNRVLLILLLLMTFTSIQGMSQEISGGKVDFSNGFSLVITPQPIRDIEPNDPPTGDRKPSRKLTAHIGDGWVMIDGVDESEILSYDINGYDGFPVGSFDTASEFTETLFSLHGEYEVCFTTDEYVYAGYVWME